MAYNKFGNVICEYKGIKFHSKGEMEYFKLLHSNPKVKSIELQKKYPLNNMHDKRTKLWYQADFVVTSKKGNEYIIEFKGRLERASLYKMAYFEYVYKRDIHMVWNKKDGTGFDTTFII